LVNLDDHAEGFGETGDGLADFAETNDAEGFSCELADRMFEAGEDGGVRPLGNGAVVEVDGGDEIEEEREDVLGDTVCRVARDITDRDATRAGGLEIDDVVARGGDEDEFELGELGDGFLAERNLVRDEDLGSFGVAEDFLRGSGLMAGEFPECAQRREVEITPGGGRGVEEGDAGSGRHEGNHVGEDFRRQVPMDGGTHKALWSPRKSTLEALRASCAFCWTGCTRCARIRA